MRRRDLRSRVFDRLTHAARDIGERGLAFLITAGVASCGSTGSETRKADASSDAHYDGPVTEAPYYDGGPIPEAPYYNDN